MKFGTSAASFVVNGNSSITATAPPGTGGTQVGITVTGPGGTSALTPADVFTYGPIVTGISPSTGSTLGGTTVVIRGAGFTGATAVDFGSVPATRFTVSSATLITATSPANAAGATAVTVTAPGGTSPTSPVDAFTSIAPAPMVSALSPSSGPSGGGTVVTLSGQSFTGATLVSFGGIPATSFTVNSANSLTATAPPGVPESVVGVTVTGPGGTSTVNANEDYTYGPLVTAVTPGSGSHLGGTTVTIKGVGLTGATAVNFGTTPVTSGLGINGTGTQITVAAPPGTAGTVNVTVTVGGTTTTTNSVARYTYF